MAKNSEKYAYLNRLSTEQLEELLRMDVEESKPGNEDVVFHILEVIEQRENEHPTGRIPDVDKVGRVPGVLQCTGGGGHLSVPLRNCL